MSRYVATLYWKLLYKIILLAGVTHQVWQPDARGSESPKDVSWIGLRINF